MCDFTSLPHFQWLLDHEIDPLCLELTFSLDTDMFGTTEVIELKPNGNSTSVTDANKVYAEFSQMTCLSTLQPRNTEDTYIF